MKDETKEKLIKAGIQAGVLALEVTVGIMIGRRIMMNEICGSFRNTIDYGREQFPDRDINSVIVVSDGDKFIGSPGHVDPWDDVCGEA